MLPEAIGGLLADRRVRYVAAGAWNSLFGWLMFVAAWWLIGGAKHLWWVIATAHFAATTQAYIVQRKYVFKAHGGHWLVQFVRFQFAYLLMLGIGGALVTAFYVQGMHPVVAQSVAMVLLAICGFIVSSNFTFTSSALSLASIITRTRRWSQTHRLALALFALTIVGCAVAIHMKSPTQASDFQESKRIGMLAAGSQWLDKNGFIGGFVNPPWFAPNGRDGATLHVDLASEFYSPIQLLNWLIGPEWAQEVDAVFFTVLAFWCAFLVGRRFFDSGHGRACASAIFAAVVTCALWSGDATSHTYQALPLALLTSLALKPRPGANRWEGGIGLAISLTAWLQFGLGTLFPALGAALVVATGFAVWMHRADALSVLRTLLVGFVLAAAINGSSIYEYANWRQNLGSAEEAAAVNSHSASIPKPACLVHPNENHCAPGDVYDTQDPVERRVVEQLLAFEPIPWERPFQGRLLAWLTQASIWMLIVAVSIRLWSQFLFLLQVHKE